jgi:hypothetical protein
VRVPAPNPVPLQGVSVNGAPCTPECAQNR